MSEQPLKFNDVIVNEKEFHASGFMLHALSLVDTDQMVVSDKYNHSDNGSKYFISYLDGDDNIIRPLYILLPQMSGYIKFFDDGKKYVF